MCKSCHTCTSAAERDLIETYLYQHFLALGFESARGVINVDAPNYTHGVWTCGVCFALVQGNRVHEHFLAMHGDQPYSDIWDFIREAEEELRSEREDH